jgi:1-acyl-sn-glycerol-3-phosphate acyltransferase
MNPTPPPGPIHARVPIAAYLVDFGRLTLGSVAVLWLLNDLLTPPAPIPPARDPHWTYALPVSLFLGFWLASRQNHPTRRLCWIAFGAVGLTAGLVVWLEFGIGWAAVILVGLSAGWLIVPRRAFQPAATGLAQSEWSAGRLLLAVSSQALMLGAFVLRRSGVWSGRPPLVLLAAFAAVTSAVALGAYRRQCFEQLLEALIWPMYRVRAAGPGLPRVPPMGPLLVVANHTAYLDPFWVMKVLPRELTPMMTSPYYDWPGIHWLMAHVIRAIRVEWSFYRREAPELHEAVRRLDQGEGVLIFPEGWVRRSAEASVRRFGQGIWRILRERPATPVVACWIEGGWGSLTSFRGGPPLRGKWPDWRRPINVGVAPPVVLDAATLADQHATRDRLRQMCIEVRAYLGLSPLGATHDAITVELRHQHPTERHPPPPNGGGGNIERQ